MWLSHMGAKVHGYSLEPPTKPNFFSETNLKEYLENSTINDIRDLSAVTQILREASPLWSSIWLPSH